MSDTIMESDGPALSVLVPVYNGERFLADTLRALISWVESRPESVELILIDDGSTDRTPLLLEAAARHARIPIRVVRNRHNQGKGAAITRGMRAARGRHRVFLDADLAYPPEEIEPIWAALRAGSDVAVASRAHPSSRVLMSAPLLAYFLLRHAASRVLNWLVRLVVLPGVRDSQAGLKGFEARAAERLFAGWLPSGFSFDIALLFRARRLGLRLAEVPVLHRYDREPSTVRVVRDTLRIVRDLAQIRMRFVSGQFERWHVVAGAWRQAAKARARLLLQSPLARALLLALLGLATLTLILTRTTLSNGHAAVAAWAAMLAFFLLIAARSDLLRESPPRSRWFASRGEIFVFLLLLGTAAFVRLARLSDLPPMIHGDSADCGLLGLDLLSGSVADVFDFSPWYSTPYLSFLPYAASFWWHGISVLGLRLPSALLGLASLVPLYFLVRAAFGVRAALVASALYALSHVAIHFSRIGLWNVQVLFYAVSSFALLGSAVRRASAARAAGAGIFSGLAVYSYTAGRLVPLVATAFLFAHLFGAGRRRALRSAGFYWGALLLTVTPLALNYAEHPEILRHDRTQSVWVLSEANRPHVQATLGTTSAPAVLWAQTKQTLAGLVSSGDRSGQYGTEQPLLSPLTAILFAIGLLAVVRHGRRPAHVLLLCWLLAGLVPGSILIIDAPSYTRLLVLVPALCIVAALGFETLLRVIIQRFPLRWADALALAILIIAQSAAFNLTGYQKFTRKMAQISREWDVLKAMERLGGGYQYYLYTGPFLLADSPVLRLFSSATRAVSGFTASDIPERLGRDTAFLMMPEFRPIGVKLSERFPGVEREVVEQEGVRQLSIYRCSVENACRKGLF